MGLRCPGVIAFLRCSVGESVLGIRLGIGHLRSPGKWLSMVLIVALCAVVASQGIVVAAANPFSNVDKDHWSYNTLAEFAEAGLIEGYSEEAFSGERPITRYEMAWAISRIVPISLSLRQMETLQRLQDEFSLELALLAGAERFIAPAGEGAKETATGSLGLSDMSTVYPISTGPHPETISGGKRLSEVIGMDSAESQGTAAGNPSKTLSIPLDAGAKAELSLGGPASVGIGQGTGEGDDVIARLDLKYALSQLAIFRASCELAKEDEASQDGDASAARATALLGIDYNFALSDSAFIKAGYSYSRTADVPVPKGVELGVPGGSEQTSDGKSKSAGFFGEYSVPSLSLDARKHTASLGVGYTFSGTTSIVLGYKLIDFHEVDPESQLPGVHRTNIATAELTIKF